MALANTKLYVVRSSYSACPKPASHETPMKLQLRLAGFGLMVTTGLAQTNAGVARRVVIEVASIRPSDPATCKEYPTVDSHGDRYDMRCVKTKFLIQTAFSVRDFQIEGGPAWIDSTQYDIAAK